MTQITNAIIVGGELLKRCPRCEGELSLTEFGVCRSRKDGLNLYCKRCIRQKIAIGRASHREYNKAHGSKDDKSRNANKRPEPDMRKLQPLDRVREAIRLGALTRSRIMSLTRLTKSQVCECLAHLLLRSHEISTELIGATRFYYEREKVPGELRPAPIADGGIDAGLLILSLITPPGYEWKQKDIAFVCGCSPQSVQLIEAAAMRKLQRRFPIWAKGLLAA